jgi:hypothetical protein
LRIDGQFPADQSDIAAAIMKQSVCAFTTRSTNKRGIRLNSTIRSDCKSLLTGLLGAAALLAASAAAAAQYEAAITRTTFGIPHIKAQDFGGLGFGVAYAEAQDNICLMADAYVSAAGKRYVLDGSRSTCNWESAPGMPARTVPRRSLPTPLASR